MNKVSFTQENQECIFCNEGISRVVEEVQAGEVDLVDPNKITIIRKKKIHYCSCQKGIDAFLRAIDQSDPVGVVSEHISPFICNIH